MTKGEKRVFRIQASTKNKPKAYILLFDVLSKMQFYDEEKALNTLGFTAATATFYNLKNYLTRYILWVFTFAANPTESSLDKSILYVKRLIQKGLDSHAKKILLRCLEQARKEERFTNYLDLTNLFIEIIKEPEEFHSIKAYQTETVAHLGNWHEYEGLLLPFRQFTFSFCTFLRAEDLDSAKSLMGHPLLADASLAKTARAKRCFHWINYSIQVIQGEFSKAYEHCLKLVNLFEVHPFLKMDYEEEYYSALGICGWIQCNQENYQACTELISKMKSLKVVPKEPRSSNFLKLRLYLLQLCHAIKTRNHNNGRQAMMNLENLLENNDPTLDTSQKLEIYYWISVSHLTFGNPQVALLWTERVIQEPIAMVRPDLRGFARILNLFILFDLGVDESFEEQARRAYRFLYTRKLLYAYEKRVLCLIGRGFYSASLMEVKEFFRKEIVELTKLFEDPFERRASVYFDVVGWMEGKFC